SDDTISFGDGISVSDVVFSVGSSGLIIRIKENGVLTNDQITVQNWGDTAYRIEKFVFKTGESLTAQQATELSWVINGTDSANALYGTYDNNTIRGFGGTDTIQDAGGSDFIDGGDGDDTIKDTGAGSNHIYGGEGKDT
ncbi:calcium-binding protein, partial [Aquabacterium parvum]|uniref:calcium-binding protein n=1 Tax=Aquabacterium parvum TaxID=70584 RepID=UPI002AA29CB1